MKAKVSAIVFLAACCLCLPIVATVATAGDAQLGVPPEHEMWQCPVELCRGVTLRAYALDEPQLMKAFVGMTATTFASRNIIYPIGSFNVKRNLIQTLGNG